MDTRTFLKFLYLEQRWGARRGFLAKLIPRRKLGSKIKAGVYLQDRKRFWIGDLGGLPSPALISRVIFITAFTKMYSGLYSQQGDSETKSGACISSFVPSLLGTNRASSVLVSAPTLLVGRSMAPGSVDAVWTGGPDQPL